MVGGATFLYRLDESARRWNHRVQTQLMVQANGIDIGGEQTGGKQCLWIRREVKTLL